MVAERYQVERTLGYEWPLMAPSKMNLLPRGCSANDCGELITFASTLVLYQAPPAGIPKVTGLRLETPTMRE